MAKFLALFTGEPGAAGGIDEATHRAGVEAWGQWVARHAASIVDHGGPLGRTKEASAAGIADTRNGVGAFAIVEAESHDAAVRMFEGHPHFTIFPGRAVEVMPILAPPAG